MDLFLTILFFVIAIWFLVSRILPAKGVKQITSDELKGMLKNKDKQFIDVRTPVEYKSNAIKEFKNIPLHDLRNKLNSLSKDKEVVVICQSGMRSNKASSLLKKNGFTKVTNVKGGMSTWY